MVEREHEVDLVGECELGDDTHNRAVELASESKPQHPAVSGGDHQQGAMATDFGRPLGFTSHAGRSSAEAAGRRRVDPDRFATGEHHFPQPEATRLGQHALGDSSEGYGKERW